MRGVYKLTGTVTSVTTAKTLAYITCGSARPIEILSARVSCQNEDTSEQIFISLNRITSLGSPTATADVPKPTEEGTTAFTGTAFANVTASEPTYDDITDAIAAGGANKLGGWEYMPLPEERPIVIPSDSVGLKVVDPIANSSTLSFEITFREIG